MDQFEQKQCRREILSRSGVSPCANWICNTARLDGCLAHPITTAGIPGASSEMPTRACPRTAPALLFLAWVLSGLPAAVSSNPYTARLPQGFDGTCGYATVQ